LPGEDVGFPAGRTARAPPLDVGVDAGLGGLRRELERPQRLLLDQNLTALLVALALLAVDRAVDVGVSVGEQAGLAAALGLEFLAEIEEIVPCVLFGTDQLLDLLRLAWVTRGFEQVPAIPDTGRADVPGHPAQAAVPGA